jgi:hypothetical protein
MCSRNSLWFVCVFGGVQPYVEAGSNTSTVALRVVGSDEKGTQCLGIKLGQPVPGGYTYGDLALQIGGVSNVTVKYGHQSRGTRDPRMIALARTSSSLYYRSVPCQRVCYIRTITASVQLKKYTGRGSQGAWREDELIGGKPPVKK